MHLLTRTLSRSAGVRLASISLQAFALAFLTACPSDSGDTGTVEGAFIDVDGKRFAVKEVRRCEPYTAGDDNIRLLVFGSDRFVVNISVTDAHSMKNHEMGVQGGGVGIFGNGGSSMGGEWTDQYRNVLPGPPFEQDKEQLSGALTLFPPGSPERDSRQVSFRVPIPAEIGDCP